jgi:hypothetical protein
MNKLTPLHLHYLKQFCNILAVGMVQTEKTAETAEKKTTAEIETMALRNFLTHLNQGWERGQSLAAFEQWIAQKTTSPKPSPLLFEPQTLVVETTTVEQSAVASVTTTLANEPPTSPPTPEIAQTNANEFFAALPWAKATPTISTTETTTVATTTTEVSTVSQPTVAEEITQPSISSHQTTADFLRLYLGTNRFKPKISKNPKTFNRLKAPLLPNRTTLNRHLSIQTFNHSR